MNIASYLGFDFSCRGLLFVFVSHRERGRIPSERRGQGTCKCKSLVPVNPAMQRSKSISSAGELEVCGSLRYLPSLGSC